MKSNYQFVVGDIYLLREARSNVLWLFQVKKPYLARFKDRAANKNVDVEVLLYITRNGASRYHSKYCGWDLSNILFENNNFSVEKIA